MEIFWRAEALEHLEHIREYIARDNPRKALDVWERIYEYAEEQLLVTETVKRLSKSGKVEGTRELVVQDYPNYIIVYRIHETEIEILAVRHGKRKWPTSF